MITLGIDTSSQSCSAAIIQDEKLIAENYINNKLTHSATLMPMIEHMLMISGITANDINLVSVSCGPGSFTGLRIGMSVVKGFCFGKNINTIGVSTLKALCYNILNDSIIIPALDARRSEVYCGIFEKKNNSLQSLLNECAIPIDILEKNINNIINNENYQNKNIIIVGDGSELCYNKFNSYIKNKIILADNYNRYLKAASVAKLGKIIFDNTENKKLFSIDNLKLEYLRLSQAERELKEKGE